MRQQFSFDLPIPFERYKTFDETGAFTGANQTFVIPFGCKRDSSIAQRLNPFTPFSDLICNVDEATLRSFELPTKGQAVFKGSITPLNGYKEPIFEPSLVSMDLQDMAGDQSAAPGGTYAVRAMPVQLAPAIVEKHYVQSMTSESRVFASPIIGFLGINPVTGADPAMSSMHYIRFSGIVEAPDQPVLASRGEQIVGKRFDAIDTSYLDQTLLQYPAAPSAPINTYVPTVKPGNLSTLHFAQPGTVDNVSFPTLIASGFKVLRGLEAVAFSDATVAGVIVNDEQLYEWPSQTLADSRIIAETIIIKPTGTPTPKTGPLTPWCITNNNSLIDQDAVRRSTMTGVAWKGNFAPHTTQDKIKLATIVPLHEIATGLTVLRRLIITVVPTVPATALDLDVQVLPHINDSWPSFVDHVQSLTSTLSVSVTSEAITGYTISF